MPASPVWRARGRTMKRTHGSDRDDSVRHDAGHDAGLDTGQHAGGSTGTGQDSTLSGPAVLAGIGGADVTCEPRRIAIVGLACRFADADDPASLLDQITTGRRAFRRIPPCRVDLADYYSATPGTPDATYSTRAALIEGWRFDRAAFGVSPAAFASADPAHWLALETAARALAAAGFPGGLGLPAQRTAAFIGNTLAGDVSRAASLRLRWPYTRRVIADALFSSGVPADLAGRVLRTAAARYLAPLPQVTADTLAGSTPGTIATRIGAHLGLRGGGMAVDAGGASALAAIASACLALSSGEVDAAVAGGVDLSLDPLDLVGLAKSGMLATGAMRIYDEHPTGFLPGEGAGMVLLMRSADARAARLPVYAEIVGWGAASAGRAETPDQPHPAAPEAAGLLLGLHRAFSMARIDPADVGLIEGSGTGVAAIDEAELTALAALRAGASDTAAFGAISANLGHTRAAAGAASLIKTVLAIANGVLPPATGVGVPHPMLRDGR
ncbi:MAG: beta-ketoacyl [acyl carrier protein] synthase domain-containing protein, partial [Streptosporangiaceae bacterium]